MIEPWYATRQQVLHATDTTESTRSAKQVDRAIGAASRAADTLCHRVFYPWTGTRTFDWPNDQYASTGRLWLEDQLLTSVTTITSGGTDLTSGVLLRPDVGPVYSYLEIDRATSDGWVSGSSSQRSISITGEWAGALPTWYDVAALAGAADDTGDLVLSDSSDVGVGSLLRLDSERAIVRAMDLVDTGQTLAALMPASASATSVTVQDGTTIHAGETITVDAERMTVMDVVGDTLLVHRVAGMGALAEHQVGAAVYAPRRLTVERGAVGTEAAAHDDATAVDRWDPPPLVSTLVVAEAVNTVGQELAGYARVAGSGENAQEMHGRQLVALRKQVYAAYGRKARTRAV